MNLYIKRYQTGHKVLHPLACKHDVDEGLLTLVSKFDGSIIAFLICRRNHISHKTFRRRLFLDYVLPTGKDVRRMFPGHALTRNHNFFTNNARIAFNTAITMTPTSAKIAVHIFAIPTAPKSRQRILIPIAK